MCAPWEVTCQAGEAADGLFENIAESFGNAILDLFEELGTFWLNAPLPDLGLGGTAEDPGSVQWVIGITTPLMIAVATVGMLIGGARMAILARSQDGALLATDVLRWILVNATVLPALVLLGHASDEFAGYVIEFASGLDNSEALAEGLGLTMLGTGSNGPLMIIILGIVVLLVSLVQLFVLVLRGAMFVVVAAFLPILSASAISSAQGRSALNRSLGWCAAFLLYKPVAALVMGLGMVMIKGNGDDELSMLDLSVGVTVLALSVIALPALVKLAVPLTAQAAGNSGGGQWIAAGATGALMATGVGATAGGAGAMAGGGSARGASGATSGGGGGGGSVTALASGADISGPSSGSEGTAGGATSAGTPSPGGSSSGSSTSRTAGGSSTDGAGSAAAAAGGSDSSTPGAGSSASSTGPWAGGSADSAGGSSDGSGQSGQTSAGGRAAARRAGGDAEMSSAADGGTGSSSTGPRTGTGAGGPGTAPPAAAGAGTTVAGGGLGGSRGGTSGGPAEPGVAGGGAASAGGSAGGPSGASESPSGASAAAAAGRSMGGSAGKAARSVDDEIEPNEEGPDGADDRT